MNATYNDFVASKLKTGHAILSDLKALNDDTIERVLSRMHAVVGLITELNEIQVSTSDENMLEELGDYYFYLTALKIHSGFAEKLFFVGNNFYTYHWEAARYSAGELLDLCAKREVIYCRELTPKQIESFEANLLRVEGYFHHMLQIYNITESQVIAANMAKLDKRYAAGYSNEAAAARADKKEGE